MRRAPGEPLDPDLARAEAWARSEMHGSGNHVLRTLAAEYCRRAEEITRLRAAAPVPGEVRTEFVVNVGDPTFLSARHRRATPEWAWKDYWARGPHTYATEGPSLYRREVSTTPWREAT